MRFFEETLFIDHDDEQGTGIDQIQRLLPVDQPVCDELRERVGNVLEWNFRDMPAIDVPTGKREREPWSVEVRITPSS